MVSAHAGESRAIGVAQLTRLIAAAVADLGSVTVSGELTQVRTAPSGHLYATLKEQDAIINVVMWRSTVLRQGALPGEGVRVEVRGAIEVYAPRGTYQLIANRITAMGAGDLLARLERLKTALAAQGLFDDERKRVLPVLPRAVGIATAAGSAALADMVATIRARCPGMPIVHQACRVQGDGAAADIAAALQKLQRHPEVELIICGRGGGSLEDLWAFNEEIVVRALADCAVPVISAVGHETDWTLADLAADVRAKTPTAAAEMAVPVLAELQQQVAAAHSALQRCIDQQLMSMRERLHALRMHRALSEPQRLLERAHQRHDDLHQSMQRAFLRHSDAATLRLERMQARLQAMQPEARLQRDRERLQRAHADLQLSAQRRFAAFQERFARAVASLEHLSPLAVIGRGYAVLLTPQRQVVRRSEHAPPGSALVARIEDGWLHLRVEDASQHPRTAVGEDQLPYRF